MTYQQLIKQAQKKALRLGLESEAVKILILELSNMSGSEFVAKLNDQISPEQLAFFESKLEQYLIDQIPIQHILGYSYFFGYKIKVNNQVLIPRWETEELVGHVLSVYDEIFKNKGVNVVDIGTGSGAIAIALAKEEPNMNVFATDISKSALEIAQENAFINKADIKFYCGDMIAPLLTTNLKFDIIVSNPPYIPEDEEVQDIVVKNEPHVALFGGKDGMNFYNIILSDASRILNKTSIIAFEHSYSKKNAMKQLVSKYFPTSEIRSLQDLCGKDRYTILINR